MASKHKEYHEVYRRWGWRIPKWDDEFPFASQPPINNPSRLAKFFSGRDLEVGKACDRLFEGNNVMVRGQWGIGKSAFILTVLQDLKYYSDDIYILPLYIYDFSGAGTDDLYRHVLLSIAKGLAPILKRAREVFLALTGEQISTTRSRGVKYGINLQIIDASGEIGNEEQKSIKIESPMHYINELLDLARAKNIRIIIAIDDLDKQQNQKALWQMLIDAKALLRNTPCKFVLTGRPTVSTHENVVLQALELYDSTFELAPLDSDSLRQAAKGHLNAIREKPRDDYSPFTEATIDEIAGLSCGIPRHFNKICRLALAAARPRKWDLIHLESFKTDCMPEIEKELSLNLPPGIRRLLYYIHEQGSISLENDEEVEGLLKVLKLDTLGEAIPYLNDFIRNDWIVVRSPDHIALTPILDRVAESSKPE